MIEIKTIYQEARTLKEYKERLYFCLKCLIDNLDVENKDDLFDAVSLKLVEIDKFISLSRIMTLIKEERKRILAKQQDQENFLLLADALTTPESPFTLVRDTRYEYYKFIDQSRLKKMVVSQKIYQLLNAWNIDDDENIQSVAIELEIEKLFKNYFSPSMLFSLYKSFYTKRMNIMKRRFHKASKHMKLGTPV